MNTAGNEHYCRRRGRPRMMRTAAGETASRCYAPSCSPNEQGAGVVLLPDEMAVLNLIDLQGLEQEEAAAALGVSRKTVWKDIHEARRKIADALINGKTIEVSGCERRLEGRCPQWNRRMCPKKDGGICPRMGLPTSEEDVTTTEQPPG
jgi:predicted DNA-binding protein (UPF0251 family)